MFQIKHKNMNYGQISNIKLYKYIWKKIINFLPEKEWYKLKCLNKTFYQLIKKSCEHHDVGMLFLIKNNLVESIICRMPLKKQNTDTYLILSCIYGCLETARVMITNGAHEYDTCFEYACFENHIDLVELMIHKGVNNWNKGLIIACERGFINIAKLMIKKGATHWNAGLNASCQGNHTELIHLMIQAGANYCFNCHKDINDHWQ